MIDLDIRLLIIVLWVVGTTIYSVIQDRKIEALERQVIAERKRVMKLLDKFEKFSQQELDG